VVVVVKLLKLLKAGMLKTVNGGGVDSKSAGGSGDDDAAVGSGITKRKRNRKHGGGTGGGAGGDAAARSNASHGEDANSSQRKRDIKERKELERNLSEERNARLCSICVDAEKNITLVPCGHQLCNGCSTKMEMCPFCNQVIGGRVRVYSS
jgi:hypothetical protein